MSILHLAARQLDDAGYSVAALTDADIRYLAFEGDTVLGFVLAFDDAAADAYRAIVEAAGYSRRKLLDRMIAAQALVHRATLVTCNGDDFNDIPGLELLRLLRL